MIVNWKKDRVLVIAASDKSGSYTLVPGVNLIPDERWAILRDTVSDRIPKDLEEVEGEVTAQEVKGPGGKVEGTKNKVTSKNPWDIKDVKAVDALIQEVNSVPLLLEWKEKEGRDGVRASLMARIDVLNKLGQEK